MSLDTRQTSALEIPSPEDCFGPTGGPSAEVVLRLFEELVAGALHLGLTTSIALGLARGTPDLERSALGRYLPARPSVLPIVVLELKLAGRTDETVAALSGLDVALVQQRTEAHALATSVPGRCDDAWLAEHAKRWQELASRLAEALVRLIDMQPAAIRQSHRAMARAALGQLGAVAEGETPHLDRHGRLVVPLVAERREHARSAARKHVHLMAGDGIQRVLVTDASTTGVGVWGLRNAAVGDRIRVLAAPGREVDGTIVWCEGLRAGIRLDVADEGRAGTLHAISHANDALEQ